MSASGRNIGNRVRSRTLCTAQDEDRIVQHVDAGKPLAKVEHCTTNAYDIGEHPYRSTGDLLLFGDSKIKRSSSSWISLLTVELQVTLAQIGDSGQSLRADSPGTKFPMQNKGTIGLTRDPGCVWKSDLPQTGNCIPRILENHGMLQTKPPPFSTCKFHPKSFFCITSITSNIIIHHIN